MRMPVPDHCNQCSGKRNRRATCECAEAAPAEGVSVLSPKEILTKTKFAGALLRFRRERRHRLLCRRTDAAIWFLRRSSETARDHVQLHAPARPGRRSGREAAIGEFTIDQAADYLEKIVPVDSVFTMRIRN